VSNKFYFLLFLNDFFGGTPINIMKALRSRGLFWKRIGIHHHMMMNNTSDGLAKQFGPKQKARFASVKLEKNILKNGRHRRNKGTPLLPCH